MRNRTASQAGASHPLIKNVIEMRPDVRQKRRVNSTSGGREGEGERRNWRGLLEKLSGLVDGRRPRACSWAALCGAI